MEFLKREGLYNPQLKEMRTDDPVATDLIGALLMVNNFALCCCRARYFDNKIV